MNIRWIGSVERFAGHASAPYLLAAIGFASSSFLPIPPDVLLVPMALLRPERAWPLCIQCTVATALGALLGYAIGAEFWDLLGERLVGLYGWNHEFEVFRSAFDEWGVWIIVLKAFTPIPFKFAAIAAGLAKMNLAVFAVAALASRALHFAIIALFIQWFGARTMSVIQKYETKAAVLTVVVLAGALVYVGLRG